MKTAIFGFAGAGKTDLFAALAGPAALAGNRAMVKVPEPRLDPLITLFEARKVTYSEIEYLDIPGGGGKGEGLGERVLNEVRSYDCLLGVLDAFSGLNDPHKQWQAIEADMMVSDMAVIEKKLERMVLDKKKNAPGYDAAQEALLKRAMECLENETPLREDQDLAHAPELRGFAFLSAKPVLYIWNGGEADFAALELPEERPGQNHIAVAAKLERELAEVEDPEERQMFLDDLGIKETALDKVIAKTYDLLGLISFLTAGEKEVRAWPVRKGAKAPEAAGVIHSDFEKGFIRAEVIGYDDFLTHGTFKACKDKGLARLEGKEYVVKDGDIIEFRFNV
ncbi:hypothetical protein SAMN02745704_01771 [Paucidesulfovibrio gracilis DSM 16080]|uniref:TGS domain-containing protein n=1 Tax=Paucidesulfovibrio gracilis DSM 16080 TaxID=1121449 RepID=A0A1T4X4X3_9BACT|nr:DUF933 domain-containing protein [Paucidesulfovibrio gracilis]SKA84497.1 hypothetical protein SAMN02745704_01771 [Paucidesulfovibrio gracilis DSM 16080]